MQLKTAVWTALASLCATGIAAHAGTWAPSATNPTSSWAMAALALNVQKTVTGDDDGTFDYADANLAFTWQPAFIGDDAVLSEATQSFGFGSARVRADILPGERGYLHVDSYCSNTLYSYYSSQGSVGYT